MSDLCKRVSKRDDCVSTRHRKRRGTYRAIMWRFSSRDAFACVPAGLGPKAGRFRLVSSRWLGLALCATAERMELALFSPDDECETPEPFPGRHRHMPWEVYAKSPSPPAWTSPCSPAAPEARGKLVLRLLGELLSQRKQVGKFPVRSRLRAAQEQRAPRVLPGGKKVTLVGGGREKRSS
jgi:hypothetical protein